MALYIWYVKQTIFSAWLLAMAGMIGPGSLTFPSMAMGDGGGGKLESMVAFMIINILFPSLWLVNTIEKDCRADSKFVDRIRAILKWPCLRT